MGSSAALGTDSVAIDQRQRSFGDQAATVAIVALLHRGDGTKRIMSTSCGLAHVRWMVHWGAVALVCVAMVGAASESHLPPEWRLPENVELVRTTTSTPKQYTGDPALDFLQEEGKEGKESREESCEEGKESREEEGKESREEEGKESREESREEGKESCEEEGKESREESCEEAEEEEERATSSSGNQKERKESCKEGSESREENCKEGSESREENCKEGRESREESCKEGKESREREQTGIEEIQSAQSAYGPAETSQGI